MNREQPQKFSSGAVSNIDTGVARCVAELCMKNPQIVFNEMEKLGVDLKYEWPFVLGFMSGVHFAAKEMILGNLNIKKIEL